MTSGVWLISAPCESEFLGYSGEPTSILYAAAVLWDETKAGRMPTDAGRPLGERDVRLFAWRVLTERVFREVEEECRLAPPRVACISATTPTTGHALRIARIIKQASPETFVLFGGPHEDEIGQVDVPGAARHDVLDASVAGDGEYILHALTAEAVGRGPYRLREFLGWLAGDEARERLAATPGTWQLTARPPDSGGPASRWPSVKNRLPERIPPLPRALLMRDRPHLTRTFQIFGRDRRPAPTAQIMTERGCAWRCSFCVEWRGSPSGYRRKLDDVTAEIEEAKRLGYGALFFDDSTMFTGFGVGEPPSRRARAVLGERRDFIRGLFGYLASSGLEWGCQSRVDTIEPGLMAEARAAGCTYIYFGAESASEEQLQDMNKEQSREAIIRALEIVRRAGIRIGLSMLFGMPSEEDPLWSRESELTVGSSLAFFASEVRKGGVVVVSRNLTAFYPGSTRTHTYFKDRDVDLWVARPRACGRDGVEREDLEFPWNRFEDGGGHHARNVTADLATTIVKKSEELLGPWLIKTYVHAHPLEGAGDGRPVVDLARNRAESLEASTRRPDVRAASPRIRSFDEVLHDSLEPLVSGASASSGGLGPRLVPIGFHILESIRRIAYIGHGRAIGTPSCEVDPQLWPIWNALDEQSLFHALSRACALPARAVVMPAVLPETGVLVDLNRAARLLARLGFDGRLVIDWSDALLAGVDAEPQRLGLPATSLFDPGRMSDEAAGCLVLDGLAGRRYLADALGDPRMADLADHCRSMRTRMVQELMRIEASLEVVGATSPVLAPHILAVRLAGVDQLGMVKRLWRDRNMLCTFAGPADLIRFQFGERTSGGDVTAVVDAMAELLEECSLPSDRTRPAGMIEGGTALRAGEHL